MQDHTDRKSQGEGLTEGLLRMYDHVFVLLYCISSTLLLGQTKEESSLDYQCTRIFRTTFYAVKNMFSILFKHSLFFFGCLKYCNWTPFLMSICFFICLFALYCKCMCQCLSVGFHGNMCHLYLYSMVLK